jgi:hypothetical protein
MANPLRKTMVYLGLADEDYDDVVPSAPVAPVSRGERAESAGRAPVTPLQGLYGKIERVTNKVFLLSPEHVAVSGEQGEVESEVEAGFFGQ